MAVKVDAPASEHKFLVSHGRGSKRVRLKANGLNDLVANFNKVAPESYIEIKCKHKKF